MTGRAAPAPRRTHPRNRSGGPTAGLSTGLRLAWAAVMVVVAVVLVVAATGDRGPATNADRVRAIAARLKCPPCAGESVLDSRHPVAAAIRADIAERVRAGQTDDEIEAALVASYGESILLVPPAEGVGALVWVLPVVVVGAAAVGLGVAFVRWRAAGSGGAADPEDLRLVEAARRRGR